VPLAHLAVFHADAPVPRHAAAQRRHTRGQVRILVTDLMGHRHQGAGGVAAHERLSSANSSAAARAR
jgi:hypothetical protein